MAVTSDTSLEGAVVDPRSTSPSTWPASGCRPR